MAGPFETCEQENLDRLCELIMDELKVLSANRQALTLSSLHRALSAKAEKLDIRSLEADPQEVKESLAGALKGFDVDPDSDLGQRLSGILKRIQDAESFRDLYLLRDDIVQLLHTCRQAMREDNRELSGLVMEISAQLIEVEKKCLNLIEKTTLTNQSDPEVRHYGCKHR